MPITPVECAIVRESSSFGGQPAGSIQAERHQCEARNPPTLTPESCQFMSGRPHFVRRHAWTLAGALAAAWLAPAFEWSALAAPPPDEEEVSEAKQSGPRPSTPESLVHLNHMSTPWTKVLQNLADGTHSTLVMHDAPSGRFSRQDWHKHTRTEAVRILNRDLEKLGYRILEKGQYLTVLEVQQSHVDYERPVVGERRAPVGVQTPLLDDSAAGSLSNAPRMVQHEGQARTRPSAPRTTTIRPARDSHDQRVVQVQHVDEDPSPPARPQVSTPEAELETSGALTSVTIKPTKRRAADIAKQIHAAFGNRSRLAKAGPHDLPAFIVSHAPAKDAPNTDQPIQPHFTVEIDSDRNELILTASEDRLANLESLIRMLDKAPTAKGQKQELVAGSAAAVAEKLQPQLSDLVTEKQGAGVKAPQRRGPEMAQGKREPAAEAPEVLTAEELFNRGSKSTTEAEGPQPGAMSEAGPDSESPQDSLPALLDTLKGDVSLESMPDLDLLILRGNEKDVEAVMRVIRAIEQMAEGSTPEIHLRRLEHVDSQSLSTLLTTVYERMTTLRGTTAQKSEAQIAVIPVVTPNAVLIIAPASALESVLLLTEELDKEVDPQHQVEVFPLEYAIASQVVTMIEDFYPTDATARPGLSARIRISADTRTNSVIIQATPRDMGEVRTVLKKIDRDEASSAVQAKIIKLKSANAEELATFLQEALQSILTGQNSNTGGGGGAGGQNSQQLRETKSVVIEFLAHDKSAQDLIRSGLLTDVRVNADPRTNSVMISAPKQSMILMEELVRVLDMPSSAVAEIKVFQLKNADAADAVTLLTALFTEAATGQQTGAIGVQLAGTSDAGSNLVPLKFSTDGRTNSVLAIGGGDALRIVEAILFRLDDNDARNRKTSVVKLKNNPAADIAVALNQFLQSQRDLAQIDPTRTSSSQLLDQEVIVTPEPLSNSLIISATPRYYDSIMDLTSQLDREQQQVAIQALLVEVTLEDNDQFGIELGFQDSLLFDRSVKNAPTTLATTTTAPNGVVTTNNTIISQTSTPGFPFNNLPLGNNIAANPSAVASQGLSNFALGRTDNTLGYGGLVLSASSNSVNVLIRALAARRNVRVLSRPSVTVLDSQLAQIQVGQIVPVANGATTTATGTQTTIERDNAGIILTVTPRISQEGQVVMEVTAEKSQYTGAGVPILTTGNGQTVNSPIKDITTAQTVVKVPDGQTIVLGGMITNSEDTNERKVPWLGDIPIVGSAFRFDSHAHRRTELLIFLTPRVIRCEQDAENIKHVEAQRIHYFEEEAELIHGPIFGVPSETGLGSQFPSDGQPTWGATATALPLQATPAPEIAPAPQMNDTQPGEPAPIFEENTPQLIEQMKAEVPGRTPQRKSRSLFQKNSKPTK